jgi:type IV secretory pathway TraG/TraD family ATPase VirD4
VTRAVGPQAGLPQEAVVPFLIIGACWVPVGLAAAVWVGGHAASTVTGHGWSGPALSVDWALNLASKGPAVSWPDVPAPLVWAFSVLVAAAVLVPLLVGWLSWRRRQGRPGDAIGSLARPGDVAGLCPPGATARARRLRPSLAARPARPPVLADEAGVPLGRLLPAGPDLRASWEDVHVVFMAPRTGKTSCLAVPQVLAAPGAVVATSNKADLWALTAAARQADTGERVWVFDPQRIAFEPQSWWWNPLSGVTTVESAQRLCGHFMAEIRSGRDGESFWTSAAEDVLSSLFLAAGLSGHTLADVYDWLNRPTSPVPVDLLRAHGQPASANGLAGRQAGATETREGVFETARTAAKCLRDPQIMTWVTPPPFDLDEFDPARFAASRQTLYLLTKDTAGGAAPLVAGFADRVMQEAVSLAERRGGRLDPPLLVVLDEAANICKIADLPKLYSHLGSRGIIPVTILQSYPQGEGVWGKTGMETLWAAATVKRAGPGLDDDAFLERLSRLVGDHDVPTRALHYGNGSNGENISLRRQRILPPEELRQLPKGTAVLLTTGSRPALVELQPWYRGPRAGELAAAEAAALAALTERANHQEVPA